MHLKYFQLCKKSPFQNIWKTTSCEHKNFFARYGRFFENGVSPVPNLCNFKNNENKMNIFSMRHASPWRGREEKAFKVWQLYCNLTTEVTFKTSSFAIMNNQFVALLAHYPSHHGPTLSHNVRLHHNNALHQQGLIHINLPFYFIVRLENLCLGQCVFFTAEMFYRWAGFSSSTSVYLRNSSLHRVMANEMCLRWS